MSEQASAEPDNNNGEWETVVTRRHKSKGRNRGTIAGLSLSLAASDTDTLCMSPCVLPFEIWECYVFANLPLHVLLPTVAVVCRGFYRMCCSPSFLRSKFINDPGMCFSDVRERIKRFPLEYWSDRHFVRYLYRCLNARTWTLSSLGLLHCQTQQRDQLHKGQEIFAFVDEVEGAYHDLSPPSDDKRNRTQLAQLIFDKLSIKIVELSLSDWYPAHAPFHMGVINEMLVSKTSTVSGWYDYRKLGRRAMQDGSVILQISPRSTKSNKKPAAKDCFTVSIHHKTSHHFLLSLLYLAAQGRSLDATALLRRCKGYWQEEKGTVHQLLSKTDCIVNSFNLELWLQPNFAKWRCTFVLPRLDCVTGYPVIRRTARSFFSIQDENLPRSCILLELLPLYWRLPESPKKCCVHEEGAPCNWC